MQTKFKPLMIDGSQGEGGGQILRSALTLSMLLQRPFELYNIRAGRAKPGLLRQHLTCVQAAAAICGAEVQGAQLGATHLSFSPGPVRAGQYHFAIGSAGSSSLVLQTLLLPLALTNAASRVTVQGGTHNGQSPSTDFLQQSFLPLLAQMGLSSTLSLSRYGFYPAGGGEVSLDIQPCQALLPLTLLDPTPVDAMHWTVIACDVPQKICTRLADSASAKTLLASTCEQHVVTSPGPGVMLQAQVPQVLVASDVISNHQQPSQANSQPFALLFERVGVRGISAETIAEQTASAVNQWYQAGAAVDEHLADQLLLPMALAGQSGFTTTTPSQHCLSNIEVIRQFGLADFTLSALDSASDAQRWLIKCG